MSATDSSLLSTNSNRTPFVSVIMNCHNGARYLREALASVQAQTFTNWEIVLWDNRSTDESAATFNGFSDGRFRYFLAPEHTVLGRARNLAVEQARGEWIGFLDCDDLWLPGKLERQVAIISEEGPDLGLVYGRSLSLVEKSGLETRLGRAMQVHERAGNQQRLPEGNIFPDLLKHNFVNLVAGMVRRSAYWSVGGIDPAFRQAEDYDLFVKISKAFKARAVQEDVCQYRIHGSNLSHIQAEDEYLEPIAIVGRYLPTTEARAGMRCHQTYFAADEIRRGHLFKGFRRLLVHGDAALFCGKFARFVWRRLRFLKGRKS